jgi:GT2 family glycosyltransferase
MSKVAIILGNYKNYNDKYWPECLASLRALEFFGEIKLYIYDNETSEESFAALKKQAPEAVIARNEINDGFAKGNNDCIKLALADGCDYFFCLNTDTVVAPHCVSEMVKKFAADKNIGAVQARMMLWPEKDKINSLGNITHFLGFGYSLGYQQAYPDSRLSARAASTVIGYPSGAAVMFSREILEKVGLFDEEFWMYNEDQDLGWRIWLAGYSCNLAEDAVVYHKYEFSRSITKYYWMDRNRIIAILKNYQLPTLILLLPAFIIMEMGLLLFAYKGGWLEEKLRVYQYFGKMDFWRRLREKRRIARQMRERSDQFILGIMTGEIWYQEVGDWKLRLANPVFRAYFWILKMLVAW